MSYLDRLLSRAAAPRAGEPEEEPIHPDPRMPVHVTGDDARLLVEGGNPVVECGGARRALRIGEISLVALHGGATVTAPCMALLAEHGVPLVLLSRSGHYRGQLVDLSEQPTRTRRAHYRAVEDSGVALAIARPLVEAKIRGARHLLRKRLGARDDAARILLRQQRRVARARSRDALMGVEGAAAAAYWKAWPKLIRNESDVFTFDGRSRRPPRDAINALLSYLYAVATGVCAATALGAGLDPRVGFLHAERPGRPALALDLVEPLRTSVVDSAVIAAVNLRRFDADDFTAGADGGVRLGPEGRRAALELLERKLSSEVSWAGAATSWRAALGRYAAALAAHLRAAAETGKPGPPPQPPRPE